MELSILIFFFFSVEICVKGHQEIIKNYFANLEF